MDKSDHPHAAHRVLNTVNQMFAVYFWKTALKRRFKDDENLFLPSIAVENATVESSLLAIRAFDDFIKSNKKYLNELVASDFENLALNGRGICSFERKKINKQIAHLTTIDLSSDSQGYSYRQSLEVVLPSAIAFCDYVSREEFADSSLVCFADDTKEICELVDTNYVNKPEA